jgi:apolipoprotein N-acyltransferase
MKPVTRVTLLIGIVVAAAFTGGQWNLPVAAWLGALLTLRYYRATTRPVVDFFVLAALVGAAGALAWNGVVPAVVTAPLPTAMIPLTGALIGMLVFVLDRWVHRRVGATTLASLVFPVAWAALDTLTTASVDLGTFGSQAYTQVGTPMIQLAALGGLPLVVFATGWGVSLAALLWQRWGEVPATAWGAVGLVSLVLVGGLARPLLAPAPERAVRIAGVSLPNGALAHALSLDADSAAFAEAVAATHRHLAAEAERLAGSGAELIVFPEAAGFGSQSDIAELRAELAEVARRHDAWIVLPLLAVDTQPVANRVEVLDPRGEVALSHVKYGGNVFEGSLRGDGALRVADTPFGRLSAVICWDADFPEVIRQAGAQDVDLMVIPANDWYEVRQIHAEMSVVRAVENGMAVFRQTGSGVSLAADAYGREFSRVDSFDVSDRAPGEQWVTLPVGATPTPYPGVGMAFGVIAGAGTLAVLGWLLVLRRRTVTDPPVAPVPALRSEVSGGGRS